MKKIVTYILIVLLFNACEYFTMKTKDTSNAVARVYDNYLYKEDIAKVLPKNSSKQDSLTFAKNYINTWANQELLLHKAEINMSEEQQESFDELVKNYKDDLFINSYKEALVNQELNIKINEIDIARFYVKNKKNFKLKETLLKFKYIQFSKTILEKNKLIKLFKSKKPSDLALLKERELELKSFHLNDSIWVKYNDVLKEIPILSEVNKTSLLQKNKFLKQVDSVNEYLILIKDVLKPNQIAPISYIAPTIEQLILHQRKLELIREIEKTLVEDAINSKNFEYY